MRFPILSGLLDSRFDAVPQNIPLELRKHGQHPGQRSTARGRQVKRFRQGHESHVECVQFLESVDQVHQRPPPAIQSPDQDAIDFSPPGRFDERLPPGSCRGPGPHVLHFGSDAPSA